MSYTTVGEQRRKEILEFIKGFMEAHPYPPTVREVGEAVDLSVATVHAHLSILQRDGRLVIHRRGPRTLTMEITA